MKYNSAAALNKAKGIIISAAAESEKRRLKMYKEPASCKPGCSHCCSRPIIASLAEAFLIKNYLIKTGKWHEVKKRITEVKNHEDLDTATWFLMNIKCPVLDTKTNMCLAYEVRPIKCALHFVSSKPSACDPWSTEKMAIKLINMDELHDRYQNELDKAFGKYIWNYQMPIWRGMEIVDKMIEISGLSLEDVLSMVAKET
jgi:Fe-S-cluster containining protein